MAEVLTDATPRIALREEALTKKTHNCIAIVARQNSSDMVTGKVSTRCHIFTHKHFCQNSHIFLLYLNFQVE